MIQPCTYLYSSNYSRHKGDGFESISKFVCGETICHQRPSMLRAIALNFIFGLATTFYTDSRYVENDTITSGTTSAFCE